MTSHDEHIEPATASDDVHAGHVEPAEKDARTPPWLTAVGVGLFVVAGLGYLATWPGGASNFGAPASGAPASQSAEPSAQPVMPAPPAPRAGEPLRPPKGLPRPTPRRPPAAPH